VRLTNDGRTGNFKELNHRMNRLASIAVTLASGLALTVAAQAQAAPNAAAAPSSTKIAVIAFQVAVAQTNEGQRDFADLQKKYDPKRQQLKTLSDEVDRLTKDLQTQGDKLSDAERATRARTIDDKKKQLDRSLEDAQNDFQQELQETYNGLASKVYDVLDTYAKQQGFTLVLDVSQQQNPVLYANESTNITKPVIDAYNAKSGVPAPPASGAAGGSGTPAAPIPHSLAPAKPGATSPH